MPTSTSRNPPTIDCKRHSILAKAPFPIPTLTHKIEHNHAFYPTASLPESLSLSSQCNLANSQRQRGSISSTLSFRLPPFYSIPRAMADAKYGWAEPPGTFQNGSGPPIPTKHRVAFSHRPTASSSGPLNSTPRITEFTLLKKWLLGQKAPLRTSDFAPNSLKLSPTFGASKTAKDQRMISSRGCSPWKAARPRVHPIATSLCAEACGSPVDLLRKVA